MAAELFTPPSKALDANANPYAGAKWFFYLAGTTTPATIYTTAVRDVPHSNPVVADSSGKFANIYFDPAIVYRAVLKNLDETVTLHDIDPVNPGLFSAFASSGGSALVGFLQSGTGATARTGQAKLRDVVNVRDFGAVGDGVTDDIAAFEAAIYTYGTSLDSIEIIIPPGDYMLSRQIIPRRSVTLRGGGLATTRLRFNNVASINATMKGAISLGLETTLTAYTTNPLSYPVRPNTITAGGADQSQILDLSVIIQGTKPAGFDYGIWSAARATVRNALLYNCGLKTVSGTLIIGAGSITGNCNTSLYDNVNSQFAPEYAFITDGTDSNNITFNRCTAFVPTLVGFYEGSQFGNFYNHCHREGVVGTTTRGYWSINPGGSNKSVFLQCYNEGDTCTVARWDIASGNGIIGYEGALPEALGSGKNAWFAPGVLAGFTTNYQINCAADGDGFTLGSAAVAATRMATDGFSVRAGDGTVGSLFRGGDGTYLGRNGASIMKLERGAAITDAAVAAAAPTKAEFDALVAKFNLVLATMRAGKPTITP